MKIQKKANQLVTLIDSTLTTQLPAFQSTSPELHWLEASYTLFHIKRLLSDKANQSLEKTLIRFLKKRWDYIKNTDAQYCHSFNNPANILCIEIAKILGSNTMPYLLILMPTLATVKINDYTTSAYNEELNLREVILSDDNTRLIHIVDVLDSALVDSTLKYNSLFESMPRELKLTEQIRCLDRHPTVENYYQSIKDKQNFVLYGETYGAYLNRLITGLRDGGKHKNGREMNAGQDANIAILDFSIFLEGLDIEARSKFLAMSFHDEFSLEDLSINHFWRLLTRSPEMDYHDYIYCVELIADSLEKILEENASLYNWLPSNEATLTTYSGLISTLDESKTAMLTNLASLEQHRHYGDSSENELKLLMCKTILKNNEFKLDVDGIVFVANMYLDNHLSDSPFSTTLSTTCRDILKEAPNRYSKKSVEKALLTMPPAIAGLIKGLVYPAQSESTLIHSTNFHGLFKRKRLETDESIEHSMQGKRAAF